mmetsp:Transcript_17897/g.27666  ORF Transcript_17897/g.27666 Transcript_17897/m.27666 type:complete len:207 (+) Transcript_17897:2535-3155(+)
MPRRLSLRLTEEVEELLHDLISEVLCESLGNSSKTLSCAPPDNTVVVLERFEEKLNDELELFKVDLLLVKHFFVFFLLLRLLGLGFVRQEMSQVPLTSLVAPRSNSWLEEDASDSLGELHSVLADDQTLLHELVLDRVLEDGFKQMIDHGEEVIAMPNLEHFHQSLHNSTDGKYILGVLLVLRVERRQFLNESFGFSALDHIWAGK